MDAVKATNAGRPRKGTYDYSRRLRGFELYAAGMKKADIAGQLGVSKMAISNWARKDRWDDRLVSLVKRAEEAVDHSVGNTIATTLATLRSRLSRRLDELEALCSAAYPAQTRMSAIRLWFDLASNKAFPDPTQSASSPGNLELLEDLVVQTLPKEPVIDVGIVPRDPPSAD